MTRYVGRHDGRSGPGELAGDTPWSVLVVLGAVALTAGIGYLVRWDLLHMWNWVLRHRYVTYPVVVGALVFLHLLLHVSEMASPEGCAIDDPWLAYPRLGISFVVTRFVVLGGLIGSFAWVPGGEHWWVQTHPLALTLTAIGAVGAVFIPPAIWAPIVLGALIDFGLYLAWGGRQIAHLTWWELHAPLVLDYGLPVLVACLYLGIASGGSGGSGPTQPPPLGNGTPPPPGTIGAPGGYRWPGTP